MSAKQGHLLGDRHLGVAAAYFVDGVFPDSYLETPAVSNFFEQFFGDVRDGVLVRIDEGDDSVDGVVVDGRLERQAFPDLRIRTADLAEWYAFGNHCQ